MTGRTSSAKRVADALRDQIVSGLPAGSGLREDAVAAEVGVSRNTLREALKLLAAEGLVNLEPNRGASVAFITADEVTEIYAVRRMLEPHAIDASLRMSDRRLNALETVVVSEELAAAEGRWRDVGTLSLRFHQLLMEFLDNSLIDSFFQRIAAQLRLGWGEARDEKGFQQQWSSRDRELLDLLRSGEVDKAKATLASYLDDAQRQTLSALRANTNRHANKDNR